MSLAFWALLGAALGAWFGVWFTAAIDLAEESARGALYFGSAGLVAGLCLRLITLAFRKKVVQG